ncbi:MAG: cytochrome c peroxidase [Bryobacteraceae bacterium]
MKARAFHLLGALFIVTVAALCVQCGRGGDTRSDTESQDKPIGIIIHIKPPVGLPSVPVPANNPMTAQTVALGRKLFYERRLSLNNSLSCASCHNPARGFSDGQVHSTGVAGKTGTRNAPTLLNAAYGSAQFWDGRAPNLEKQVGIPMANPVEMAQPDAAAVAKLQADPVYRAQFQAAFGPGPITMDKVAKALASFERTLITGNSPFDRYEFEGDKTALSPAAIRGLAIFKDPQKGNCVACHTIDQHYALFTDHKFHNIGVGVDDQGVLTDLGRYNVTHIDADKGAFKTPSLRNIAQSGPYMHDGSLKTLKEVVDFYAGGGNSNPYLDKNIKAIHLTGQDRSDLVAFLESLTGDPPKNDTPPTTGVN